MRRKGKGNGNPGKPGKRLRLEDLQSQFGVGLKEAANRLGICPTTLKARALHMRQPRGSQDVECDRGLCLVRHGLLVLHPPCMPLQGPITYTAKSFMVSPALPRNEDAGHDPGG